MKLAVAGASPQALRELRAAAVAADHELEAVSSLSELQFAFASDSAPDGAVLAGPGCEAEVVHLRETLGQRAVWLAAWVETQQAGWVALGAGADDVFVGATSAHTLSLRMAVGERTLRHARTQQRLRFLARHPRLLDPMTGTLRPGVLEVQLDQALARVGRTQQSVALLAIEAAAPGVSARVDLSSLVVSRVASAFRSGDGVAIDDDRTVLAVLEGCSPVEAERIAADVVRRLTTTPREGAGIIFSCAVGVATQTPGEQRRDASTVMDAAGSALARAWMGGGDRVEVAGMGATAIHAAERAA